MSELLAEAQKLPQEAVGRARAIAWVKPPDHLVHLVDRVRAEHGAALSAVHAAIDERLSGWNVGGERGAFYAASELAVIEELWRGQLAAEDRGALRACWNHLRAA